MIDMPKACAKAEFAPGFGRRVLLTVDTEEEFDWSGPFTRDSHGLSHVPALIGFQEFCEDVGAHPVYLVDWPIANDPRAVEIIGDAVKRGCADVGVQLHPWVNPPFDEVLSLHNSFAGNLPYELERAKFLTLRNRIEDAFGKSPHIYRAGRYGLGPNSAEILKEGGIRIDTSVRSLFDYSHQSGPDFSKHPIEPYWVDEERSLLEAPMTTVYQGAMRQMGERIQKTGGQIPKLLGAFARLGIHERIALTPEGVSASEALRAIDLTIDTSLPLTVLSFHSPSLVPGFTPYTKNDGDVEALYEWFTQVFAKFAEAGVRSAKVEEVIGAALK